MKFRRRAKRRTSHRRTTPFMAARLPLAALVVAALGLWVMLPFGGVTLWARDAILLSSLAAAGVLWLLAIAGQPRRPADLSTAIQPGDRWWRIAMLLLLVWAIFQMVPLPAALLRNLQPGWHLLNQGLPGETSFGSLAINRIDGFYNLSLWVVSAVLAGVVAHCFRDRQAARVLAHVIAGLGLLQAFAALAIPGMLSSWWDTVESRRLLGTFANPNAFGGLLALTVPVTLGLLLTLQNRMLDVLNGRWKRLLALPSRHHLLLIEWIWVFLSLLAQTVTLIGSGSRGAVLSTMVSVTILFVAYIMSSKSTRGIALQMTGIVLAAILALATGGGLYLLLQRFEADALWDSGFAGRVALWRAALRLIGAFPLGVGAGAFPAVFTSFEPPQFGAARLYYAHNDYLQWTAEFGIPGLILLVLVLAGIMRRGVATFHIAGVRHSVWIWRGAAAGVIASLAHAVVDFNLMMYPGVRTMFFIVCGLMLGVPRQGRTEDKATKERDDAVSGGRSRPTLWRGTVVLAVGLAVVIWLVIPATQRILTAQRVEGARRTLGLPPDKVFWVPPPWIPGDQAFPTLVEARERMPQTARYAYWLAIGRLAHYEQERRAAIETLRKEYNFGFDIDGRHSERMIDLAMQLEFRQALDFAREQLEQAVVLAPWDADMRAFAGYVNARLAEWEGEAPAAGEYRHAAIRYIDGALRLAPYDVSVLMETCRASASLFNAAMIAQDDATKTFASRQLTSLGRRVVDIDPTKTVEVLAVWESADMVIEQLTEMDTLPLPILDEVYRYFSQQNNAPEAMRLLNYLMTKHALGETAGSRIDSVFLEREKCRWLIWDRDWKAYREAFEERRNTWYQRQLNALAKETGTGRHDATLRIHMRTVDREIGLNVENLLRLSQLESDRGATREAMALLARALAIDATADDPDDSRIEAFKVWRSVIDSDREHYAERWLACRLLRADKLPRDAAWNYKRLAEHPRLPLRFRHRISLETAVAWMEAGETDAALSELQIAIRDGADDPDVLRKWIKHELDENPFRGLDGVIMSASERLALLQPDHALGVRYMGERIELMGLTLEPYGAVGSGQTRVRSYWRFFDRVPSDLRVRIVARTTDGYAFFQRTSFFGREMPDRFSAGEPRVGNVLILNTPLPAQARAGDRLILTLHAGKERLASIEGLPRLDINDWTRLLDRGD